MLLFCSVATLSIESAFATSKSQQTSENIVNPIPINERVEIQNSTQTAENQTVSKQGTSRKLETQQNTTPSDTRNAQSSTSNTANIRNTRVIQQSPAPTYRVVQREVSEVRVVRPVFLTSDINYGHRIDMAFLNKIAARLRAMGVTVLGEKVDPDGEFAVFRHHSGDLVVAKIQYNCAGTLWGYTQRHFQRLMGTRRFMHINISPRTSLRELSWLPRAHDDTFTSRSFRGLANPYQHLRDANIEVVQSRNIDTISNAIFNQATERVKLVIEERIPIPAPRLPAENQAGSTLNGMVDAATRVRNSISTNRIQVRNNIRYSRNRRINGRNRR